jgi:hypothetical protein
MPRSSRKKQTTSLVLATLILLSNVLFGFPADMLIQKWNDSKIVDKLYLAMQDNSVVDEAKNDTPSVPTLTRKAGAANFNIQTGYYVGTGAGQTISGLGFQPQSVFIKASTTAGQGVWKSKDMSATNTAYFSATANDTASMITLNSDGFTLSSGANVSSANVRYTWVAFAGSDCTASGTVCVGTYTGNGTNPRLITTGFQPAFAMVKRSTAVAANFRTASMASNMGQYFTTTAQDTTGTLFTTIAANGFNAGATDNTSAGIYYYVAFKAVAGVMAQGTYTGNATDNTNITGFGSGFTPNFAFVKNATSATTANRNPIMNFTHSYGDSSSYMSSATANVANMVQLLQDNGLQVGSGVNANETGATMYWVAFGGASAPPPGSGSFDMATGSYSGNGTVQSISGLGFKPDLVIVKDNAANQAVFRTSLMAGDDTAYLASATADFTGGITSLGADGFSVGSSVTTNTSGSMYQWQAFGNAYKPTTNSGAADFMIGAYTGSGADNRGIAGLPTQPSMVAVKRNGATAGTWRSAATAGDLSSFFGATAEAANRIQSLDTFGYQIGTQANVNTSGSAYNWFAFKGGENFATGTYSGTGSAQNITTPGFQTDLAWIKRSTAVSGVSRGTSLAGDNTQYFLNTANVAGRITTLNCNGFSLGGAQTETNTSAGVYRYAAWRIKPPGGLGADIVDGTNCSVGSPSVSMSSASASFGCTSTTGTLGTSGQKLRVTNTSGSPAWSLSIAPTGGQTALWSSGSAVYDYNDPSGSPAGCSAGGDSDAYAGLLGFNFGSASATPSSGCDNTGLSIGSANTYFSEGVTDSVTLAQTNGSAASSCHWDFQNIGLNQQIPASQSPGSYSLNLTVTLVAN